ncbi:hypothetical protein V6N13_040204 [Hibiscus sabdariffa]
MQVGDKTEYVKIDIRPSDLINIGIRCKHTGSALQIPIHVNKCLASSDGMSSGQRCIDSEKFKMASDLNEAISHKCIEDVGTLPLYPFLLHILSYYCKTWATAKEAGYVAFVHP